MVWSPPITQIGQPNTGLKRQLGVSNRTARLLQRPLMPTMDEHDAGSHCAPSSWTTPTQRLLVAAAITRHQTLTSKAET